MNKSLWFLAVTLIVLATGCSKKVTAPTVSTPKTTLNIEEIDFDYFQGKARMILRDANKEREVKATIRVRKDSVIWMQFNVIGIQGGKALINKDSITIVSTVDKEYYVFDYAELSKRFNFNINYGVIQSAMLGNPIIARSGSDQAVQESSMYLLKQQVGTINVVNYVNAASMKIEKVELKEGNSSNSLIVNYSNFQPVGDKVFPYNGTINLFYKTLSGLLNTTIIFEYNKAEVGTRELKFPFNIPKRYERR
ncbi:DUF4292 domain-containing protein [Fulvivirgaceae bacterium PWU4]|uniref:DUF4292 domain-containing protein n=1 Tax=Chryseosolibacter histidini TaxID=2782349 RepID=A0AAP2DSB2_9BACT|nr:DUF4292 domain-containing protein [Chryseosolibacter histidini]MBT1700579.1 DUF4292 domain-containing protein [Chryseosolibacter histidini]